MAYLAPEMTRPGDLVEPAQPEQNWPKQERPDYDWLYSRTRQGQARGPQRARALLDQLGSPDQTFQSIRVIGTNGKGSTCTMLEAGLIAAGLPTGRFTSPHLERFEERIRTSGQELDPRRSAVFIAWARQHAPDAAFFDLTLGLACSEFARAGVSWAVMEAGVGGRSDGTQALHRVAAVSLTNVALDHTAVLGPGLSDIARDKAGAALAGVPLLTTAIGEGLDVIRQVAGERGTPLYTPQTHPALFELPHPPRLAGPHQIENAQLAAATLRLLGSGSGIEAALDAGHPARLERFGLPGNGVADITVLLDGAHNPHAARALAAAVPHADVLLFGNLARKDTGATLAPLLALAPRRVFTSPGDLASDPRELARRFGGEAVEGVPAAFARARALTPPGGTLLVTGSLYLAGTVRGLLLEAAR
ncbi:folylpolyglutamate synthase/dihydrofolate synthase family protein [Deinococcus rubellus]|uniref:tetrahydrofolate synthase n=1 Tax=Deinococcus rubellus TaxID=1889240 RepID=A0ABY5YGU6_9DEIO|nr:bifunctional folylpolyglutamate synthase/dihydrofolate synthase [Deinococcus rubellus]UWX63622.1 bifunctional folylpolyglutamate synthase/dihydrofolate synthase [Deinococcus rubellus]